MSDKALTPEEELISAQDAWADYISLKRALTAEGEPTVSLNVTPETFALIERLVKSGVCEDEVEVLSRAVRAFFVAVFPEAPERERILHEAAQSYRP